MASGDMTPGTLSGSSNGRPITVAATGSPGTTIHTPQSGASPNFDMVSLYATNINASGATRTLYIQFGGTGTSDAIRVNLAPNRGPVLIVDRWAVSGSGQIIRAYADVANEVVITGRNIEVEAPA